MRLIPIDPHEHDCCFHITVCSLLDYPSYFWILLECLFVPGHFLRLKLNTIEFLLTPGKFVAPLTVPRKRTPKTRPRQGFRNVKGGYC